MTSRLSWRAVALAAALPMVIGLAACSSGPTAFERAQAARLADRGDMLEDEAISSKVAAGIIAEPRLRDADIHVATFDNVVRLTGTVEQVSDADRAHDIAVTTRGVRGVENRLVIRY
jgi:hyperosmotically inducible protein